MKDLIVQHNERQNKFFIELDGFKSKLKYRKKGKMILEIYKTEVPVELRGKGLARQLAEAALNYARENGYKVKPACGFMQSYIEKNPQYNSLVI